MKNRAVRRSRAVWLVPMLFAALLLGACGDDDNGNNGEDTGSGDAAGAETDGGTIALP